MADYSEGLIRGLQSAIGSYYDATRAREDREERRRMADMEYRAKGLLPEYDESGKLVNLGEDPAYAERQRQRRIDEAAERGEILNLGEGGRLEYGGKSPIRLKQELEIARAKQDPLVAALKEAQGQKLLRELSQPNLTPAQEAADKKFGADYQEYQAGGGKAGVQKNLGLLREAVGELRKEDSLAGGFTGYLPDWAQDFTNPKLSSVRDRIQGAIQSTLRQTLGAQFTEKEGQKIFERAFNPRLSDEENIKRAEAVIAELEQQALAKDEAARYYEQYGTLQGFKPASGVQSTAQQIGGGLLPNQAESAPQSTKIFKTNEIEWAD